MAYNEKLANRIRESLVGLPNIEEKYMFGGIAFMYNEKMCVGVIKDEMICRIDPAIHNELVERQGCRTMDFSKRPMKGFIMIDETGMKTQKQFQYWVDLALAFNKNAKPSRKNK